MAHEFIRREEEPEPQASGSRSGTPPRKRTGVSVLDPPFPPKKPLRLIPAIPQSALIRAFAVVILVGLALVTLRRRSGERSESGGLV
jgi:hypothetical protein